MKVCFYFNDYKQENETGTFIFFEEAKKYVKSLSSEEIEFSVAFESSLNADSFTSDLEKHSLEAEVTKLQKKLSSPVNITRFRLGSLLQKVFKFFYINLELINPDKWSDYENFLKLKTKAFENIVDREGINLVVYLHYFYFPSLNLPYILFAWDFAHRNIIGHLEFINEFDWRERIFKEALEKAYRVITCNEAGKKELIEYGQVPEERISIIPFSHPIVPKPEPDSLPANLKKPYIFLPAGFWAHKNHITLIKALNELVHIKSIQISLVMVGNDRGNLKYIQDQITKYKLGPYVQNLGFVERSVVWELYRNAEMLVFPSLLGPNNLPPLESLSVGCPAIVSRMDGHEQQFADSVLYFDPLDHNDLAVKIEDLFNNDELKEKLLSNAEKLIEDTSPKRYFQRLLPILLEFKLHSSTYTS
jgi:glycosyltransferase involved in cell wall biosynthesis